MIKKNLKERIYTSLLLFLILFMIAGSNFFLVFSLLIFFVLSIIEFLNLTIRIILNKFALIISNFFFIIYILFFCLLFFYFSNFIQSKIIIFSLLLACIASDIGGYVFGKYFKGPKLIKISPNKTYSGAFGSLIFSSVIFSSSIYLFTNNFNLVILLIGLVTSVSCQIGDLFFSYLKRKAKIKDTGNFLPGHGGVLDRLDGILFGVPLGFFSLTILY